MKRPFSLPSLLVGCSIGVSLSLMTQTRSSVLMKQVPRDQHGQENTALADSLQDLSTPTVENQVAGSEMPDSTTKENIENFLQTAKGMNPTTDKVTAHSYHNMYGIYLTPMYQQKPTMKLLEIGLGCGMDYGPGASVRLWKTLFPRAELWEAEYDGTCVNASQQRGELEGINVVVGDQGDPATLDRWIAESGGRFDAIIDDGGHKNRQIRTSMDKLWPEVLPGGLYFIEDMQVGRVEHYENSRGKSIMSEVMQDWIEQLIYEPGNHRQIQHKVPPDVLFVSCQREACVIGKKHDMA